MQEKILENKTILITRESYTDTGFSELLKEQGADIIHLPTIKIIPAADYSVFDKQIEEFNKFDYLIFSSSNAVKFFAERIADIKADCRYDNLKVIAVGTSTSRACKEFNIPVDILPDEFSAKGVFDKLKESDLIDKNILIPASVIGRHELKEKLEEYGANVFMTFVYDNIIPPLEEINENLEGVRNRKPDLFVFTSPSTFNNFVELLKIENVGEYFEGTDIAAIGSVTAAAISEKGLKVSIIPDEFTMNSLTEKIVQYYNH